VHRGHLIKDSVGSGIGTRGFLGSGLLYFLLSAHIVFALWGLTTHIDQCWFGQRLAVRLLTEKAEPGGLREVVAQLCCSRGVLVDDLCAEACGECVLAESSGRFLFISQKDLRFSEIFHYSTFWRALILK
jgi:hypothetical protein